jgi:hypothetical protein
MFTKLWRRPAERTHRPSPDRRQPRLGFERLEDRALPAAAFVLEWNDLLVDVQQLRAQGNQQAARALAMMGAAVYDSVNAIDPTHTVYQVDARAFPGVATASADAAAAQAAHDVAYALYTRDTERPRIDDKLDTHLGELLDHGVTGIAEGIALGQHVAAKILAWRASDGSNGSVPYTIGTQPGDWQPTPPAFSRTPATPHWPFVTPFALDEGSQFRAGPPPALTSADYTEAFLEVKDLGSINSTTRTPEQTEIALYWATAGVGLWNQITGTVAKAHDLTLAENARLFAQVNVANADAFIASYDVKYAYNFWRPVTAIWAADTDGNPDTIPDPTWKPLIATPNHPSYGSNHSAQSRAAAEALASFFGTDHVSFTATSAGIGRSYETFTEAAKEGGRSRIFAGIHWSFDCAVTESLGRKIGQYVVGNYFQPLDNPSSLESVGPSGAAAPKRAGNSYAPHGLFDGEPATGAVNVTVPDDRAIDDQGDASAIPVDGGVTDTGDEFSVTPVGGGITIAPWGAVYADLFAGIAADFALTDPDEV